ncbi:acyl-CoA-binding domain-containing protein 3-like [Herrania umbratica]|uniref:Acyl-CoA-binding domain-containing protein 3-like n=1 Tax=Herrania umbratica TaxID=108875 RepID=A0A6J0ZIW1_9ROSI|nr:acyl-CoA-binding domain-containing protein 3-like [Herrania umbratica]
MELFLEFLFTISLSFILSFILAKLLSLSSVIDQHLEAVSRSCMEVTAKSEKYVLECEKGLGFVSEVVKVDALGESAEGKKSLEEASSGSYGSPKITEEPTEESYGQENFVKETTEIELAKDEEEEIEVLECEKENGGDCLKEGLSDEDDDDNDWERVERTELKKDFVAAVRFLGCKSNADQTYDLKIANDVKMQFYGLYKIATEGPCHEPQPMALKLSARAKWNAWKRLGNMSPEAAMEQYITLLSRSIPGWMQDDICGESKQHYADNRACRRLPLDVNTMPENQTIAVDYRTLNELKAHV